MLCQRTPAGLSQSTRCSLVSVLRVLAIAIFVGGAIGGFVLGKQFSDIQNVFATSYRDHVDFCWGIAVAVWLSAILSGSLLFALREVLMILQLHQMQSYTIGGRRYFPNRSLCVTVRVKVSTSTSSSIW